MQEANCLISKILLISCRINVKDIVLTVNSQKSMLSRLLLLCILPFILLKEGFPWLTLQVAPLGFSEDGVTLPNKNRHISDKEYILQFAQSKKFTKENTLSCSTYRNVSPSDSFQSLIAKTRHKTSSSALIKTTLLVDFVKKFWS